MLYADSCSKLPFTLYAADSVGSSQAFVIQCVQVQEYGDHNQEEFNFDHHTPALGHTEQQMTDCYPLINTIYVLLQLEIYNEQYPIRISTLD